MTYSDYVLLQAGFANKRRHEQRLLRRAVTKLLQPYMDKRVLTEYQIWPVAGDEKLKDEEREERAFVSEKTLKRLEQMKEREKNQKSKEN